MAVLGVLAYHAGIVAVPGGFVGVDVSFIISGYLIMATLAADIRRGCFSVLAFYERRIRRSSRRCSSWRRSACSWRR